MERSKYVGIPRPVEGHFNFDILIAGGAEQTVQITLPSADFVTGQLFMYLVAPTSSTRIRLAYDVMFTTDENDGTAQSGDIATYNVYGYLFDNWMTKGFRYDLDGQLSTGQAYGTGGTGQSRIKHVKINGDKLEITWRNQHGSLSSRVVAVGHYKVWN